MLYLDLLTVRNTELTTDEMRRVARDIEDTILNNANCEGWKYHMDINFSLSSYKTSEFGYVLSADVYDIETGNTLKKSVTIRVSDNAKRKDISKGRLVNAGKLIWNKIVAEYKDLNKFKAFEDADYSPWA